MKELNDNDFDYAFKQRITEAYPEFEEESWLKMENKLRKKDRLVFLRNASIVLLVLSFGLISYFITSGDKVEVQIVKAKKQELPQEKRTDLPFTTNNEPVQKLGNQKATQNYSYTTIVKQNNDFHPVKAIIDSQDSAKTIIVAVVKPSAILNENLAINPANQSQTTNTQLKPTTEIGEAEEKLIKDIKAKRKIPISLAISAGPDLNSTSSIIGGKTSVAVGVGISVGLTKKLSLQTGLIYGSKNYTAEGYDYTFNNPNIPATIESIQALCKVLEIPLKASYLLNENKKRSIEFNAGLSSYLMLKENYVFKYTAASGRKDRTNEVVNANQHLLSVVELSATYNLKLKNKKFAFGIEPYVKIPLGGVGEGNILLKSSGVSLKLRYDINKKY